MRLLPLFLFLAVAAGCGSEASGDGRIRVVATTSHAFDIARNVAGDRAVVTRLVAEGADPHDYELRPSDADALAGADLVVRSGGEIDEWAREAVPEGAEVLELDTGPDPHWWHDPRRAVAATGALAARLGAVDGANAAAYDRAGKAYADRIADLDDRIEACVRTLPRERRTLVTTHDAFGSFAERYGFDVIGTVIPSRSTQAQPSSADTAKLLASVREAGVPAIFPETSVAADVERALAEEAGVRVGPALYADTLGPAESKEGTYLGASAFNARSIVTALGGRCDL